MYERDFKGRKYLKGSDAIQGGNFKAYGGDAVADAMVFDEDGSLDKTVYEELYGLQHTKVLERNGKRMRHTSCIQKVSKVRYYSF